jgi:predicted metal-dependent hydrolase
MMVTLSEIYAANRREPAPAIDRSKAAVDPVAAFKLRCEARAHLYSQGEFDLHEAVDALQESAPPSLSIDAAQAIMAKAFKKLREKERSAENAAHIEEKPNIDAPPGEQTAENAAAASARAAEFNPPSPTKLRLQNLWLATMAVRDKGDRAELEKHFMDLARESGLIAASCAHYEAKKQRRRWGEEDVAHVISWGLRGMNPWHPGEFLNEYE